MQALQEVHQEDFKYPEIPIRDESDDGRMVSEEEYWEHYYIHPYRSYEWNDGRLEERPMTNPDAYIMYHWFYELLSQFLKTHPIGMMIGLDFGFHLALPWKKSVRKPDLAVILRSNPVQPHGAEASYKGIFDLCIESLSHSGTSAILRDTKEKKMEYGIIGVKEYYILDSRSRDTAFYRRKRGGGYSDIKPKDGVIRSATLPGFQFRVSDLYSRPSLLEMAEDEVYTDFVLPFYTEEKQRAEQERQRAEQKERIAEQERQRAEQERQRAEQKERIAEQERQRAEQKERIAEQERQRAQIEKLKAEKEKQQAEKERRKNELMAQKLRAMGVTEEEIKSLS